MTVPYNPHTDELLAEELEAYQQSLERGDASLSARRTELVAAEPLRTRFSRAKRCLDLLWAVTQESKASGRAMMPEVYDLPEAVGRFQIQAELGSGGFGIVYLALDPVTGRQVALKVPRIQTFASAEMLQRFQHESTAAAKLDHPSLVPVLEAGLAGTIPYIASMYYDGPTLSQWLAMQTDSVTGLDAANLVRQLASAVHHAHARGVLHRDIKPSNILLAPREGKHADSSSLADFVPKSMDFGLAKLTESTADITKVGVILGTARYMAPEQARGDLQATTTATDVYSLGVCLYELLTGHPLFNSANDVELLLMITTVEPRRPRRARGDVPVDLETICLKCLAKDPKQRYRSAGELADEFGRCLDGKPILSRPTGGLERLHKWVRRRPALAVLLGAACLSLVTMIGGSLWFNHRLTQSLADAQFQRQRAEDQARLAMEHVYASDMAAAQQAWLEGNLAGTSEILTIFESIEGQPDQRGAEWYYLRALIDGGSQVLTGHTGRAGAVTFSPDGRWLVSAGQDGIVRLWDAEGSRPQHYWQLPGGPEVNAVTFSPDSQQLAAATDEGLVRRWDLASRAEQTPLRGHEGWVADVCFSPDGRRIASAGSDGNVQLWEVASGESIAVLRGHQGVVRKVRFVLEGVVVVSTSEDQSLRLWRGTDGLPLANEAIALPEGRSSARPTDMAVSPDGQTLAVCVESTFVSLWRIVAPGSVERLGNIPSDQVRCLAFSSNNGERLLFGGNDTQIYEYDLKRQKMTAVRRGHEQQILSIAASPSGTAVATGSRNGELRLWKDGSGQSYRQVARLPLLPHASAFDLPRGLCALGTNEGQIAIVDTVTGELRRSWQAHPQVMIEGLEFSAAGDQLVSRSDARGCRVWQVETGKLVADHPDWCVPQGRVLFAPDGEHMLVASGERLELVKLATGAVMASASIPSSFQSLAYAPNARYLAVGGHAGELWILTADDLQVRHRLVGHSDAVHSLVFSPSGQLLCSSSDDRSNWLWDWQRGQKRQMLSGSDGALKMLQFLPGERAILGVAPDETIRFWNVSTRRKTLQILNGAIHTDLRISPDGRRVYLVLADDEHGDGVLGYLPIASE